MGSSRRTRERRPAKMVKVDNCGEIPATPTKIEARSSVQERSDKTKGMSRGKSKMPVYSISRMTQMARVRRMKELLNLDH